MKAITLRNIPKDLAKVLERKARSQGKSLNRVVLELLARACGTPNASPRAVNSDFDAIFGAWTDKEADEFDAVLREQRQIDPELWK